MNHIFSGICLMGLSIIVVTSCQAGTQQQDKKTDPSKATDVNTATGKLNLPLPYPSASVTKVSKVIGWPDNKAPNAPEGFRVTKFADSLNNPRWIYVADNGDVFIAESNNTFNSANRITLFRNGEPGKRYTFLEGLNKPFGMLIIGNSFYVANTDALMKYPYTPGSTSITDKGKKILSLPASMMQRHWTRNIITNSKKDKIYIAIGSSSNVGENGMGNEERRASILEINPDGTGETLYASGLRNPVGMGWISATNTLWTAVNERDELGDNLVPDYLTSVKKGGFYGWPYSYFGQNLDPRLKADQHLDMVAKAIVPDVSLGSHTASLGLVFYDGKMFPGKYKDGAFIGQHGSWNSSVFVGYKVVFIPFKDGKPSGPPEDFLTGFIADEASNKVYGRPVGVAVLKDGSLLVADDAGEKIWRVSKK